MWNLFVMKRLTGGGGMVLLRYLILFHLGLMYVYIFYFISYPVLLKDFFYIHIILVLQNISFYFSLNTLKIVICFYILFLSHEWWSYLIRISKTSAIYLKLDLPVITPHKFSLSHIGSPNPKEESGWASATIIRPHPIPLPALNFIAYPL